MLSQIGLFCSAVAIAFGSAHSVELISRPEALSLLGRSVKRHLGSGVPPHIFHGAFKLFYGERPWSIVGIFRAFLVSLIICLASYAVFFVYNPEYVGDVISGHALAFYTFNTRYFFFVNLPTDIASVLLVSVCFWLMRKNRFFGGFASVFALALALIVYGSTISLFQNSVGQFDQVILTEYECGMNPEYRHYVTSPICGVMRELGFSLEDQFAQIELAVTAVSFEPQQYNAAAGSFSVWLGSLTPYLYSTLFAFAWLVSAVLGTFLSYLYRVFAPAERLIIWLIDCEKHPLKALVIAAALYLAPVAMIFGYLTS